MTTTETTSEAAASAGPLGALQGLLHSPRLFDIGARAYDLFTNHGLWREQAGRLLEARPAAARAPRDLLDLGCGPGPSTFALAELLGPEARVVGIDLAPRMVERLRHHHRTQFAHLARVRFALADATRLPFADASFDLVTGHSFLYLVPDPAGVLREAFRVLRPGGALVLMEPNAQGSLARAALAAAPAAGEVLRRPSSSARLVASMLVWRLYSGSVGRLSAARVAPWLRAAGFEEVRCAETLGGLGLHVSGLKRSEPGAR